ncbi:hypothetical protein [Deinococcus ruber]|uniref:Uncharacterized protein n=1 Tax=Deinococcus ruber TaxID=1848197 RepID=A0A918C5F1_9DEIO|nr:hypothetical protein [Deinococcus ruber]GGR07706.1 hypothetical protein GCM10008957_20490 [Deinococcus ruber]
MLLKDNAGLERDEGTRREVLREMCSPVRDRRRLALDVCRLFRERNAQPLDQWLGQAASYGFPDIQTLVTTLRRERNAFLAAVTYRGATGRPKTR